MAKNFEKLIFGGLHEKHAVQRGIWVPTQHLHWDQGKPRKTLIELATICIIVRTTRSTQSPYLTGNTLRLSYRDQSSPIVFWILEVCYNFKGFRIFTKRFSPFYDQLVRIRIGSFFHNFSRRWSNYSIAIYFTLKLQQVLCYWFICSMYGSYFLYLNL
jgi:hypothetical protein